MMLIHMKRMIPIKVLIFILLIFGLSAFANKQEINQQLRLAYTLERNDQSEQAQFVYENLYSRYPNSKVVFQRLMKNYFDLHQFSKARDVIKRRKLKNLNESDEDLYFVELLYRVEQPDSAATMLRQIAPKFSNKLSPYLELGSRLMASRLYDEAISVYSIGRDDVNQKSLFALNLSTCYQMKLEYDRAVRELLLYIETQPKQFNYVQKQILRFPMTSSVINAILPILKNYLDENEGNQQIQSLIMKLLIKDNQYEKAFKLTFKMEANLQDKSKAGAHLFMFGEQAAYAHAYEVAQKAFESVLNNYPNYPHKNHVWFRLAQVLEDQKKYDSAHKSYTKASEIRPQTSVASKALLCRGKLERDQLKHLDQAIATFHILEDKNVNSRESHLVKIELAHAYMLLGDLQKAQDILFNYLKQINSKHELYVNVIVDLSQYFYFQGEFSKALNQLQELTLLSKNNHAVESPLFNDGLKQIQFIQQVALQDSNLFTTYSHSEWLIQRELFNQAESELDSLIEVANPELKLYPLQLKGKLNYQLGHFKKSLKAYQSVVAQQSNDPILEEVQYNIGKIYFLQKEKNKAMEELEKFLQKYPFSFYKDEVRQMIRDLEAKKG